MAKVARKDKNVQRILKSNSTPTLTVEDGDTVHFLVTQSKGPNYSLFCQEIVLPSDPISTIKLYTEHTNDLYAKVNLSLAADSPLLEEHSAFIPQLRGSILSQPLLEDPPFYRGVDLSELEINQMEKLGTFFIPSFTSTSLEREKAYEKSALVVIDTPYLCRYGCSITEKLSNYYGKEKEVLFACYCAFRLSRIEKVNQKIIVSLFLDEMLSSADKIGVLSIRLRMN